MTLRSDEPRFEQLLEYLQQARGFDFLAYKPASLMRRVRKRMQAVSVPTYEAYLDYLLVHPDEFAPLFNTILINVTSFFRDKDVWDYMRDAVLPELVERHQAPGTIRLWSAGCASGQEPYTLAILLAENCGFDWLRERVKIYATDVDEDALGEARLASYNARQVEDVPPQLLEKYFDRNGAQYSVNRELRRAVIFGRHDLLQDAPISRVDLLVCRNTLMYFQADAQGRILARFYFSLNPRGYIQLGRAEMLFSHAAMFTPVDLKRRLFRAVPKPNHRDRLLLMAQPGRGPTVNPQALQSRLSEAAFDANSAPQIVVDTSGALAAVNAAARIRFGLTDRDLGRPLQDLEVSFRPAELRVPLERVRHEGWEVAVKSVPWIIGSESRVVDIVLTPLRNEERVVVGTCISFHDVTDYTAVREELQRSKQELETAYEELQSTNEELETTNEELQSTNEELETMNEELQSANQELQTMNDELRNRSTDLNIANAFLESVFATLRSAVVALDREFRVQVWNDHAAELWGLRREEVSQVQFLSLDIGLPVADLRQPIRQALTDGREQTEVTVLATNRRGRALQCRVTIAPLKQADTSIGVMLLMDEARIGTHE